MQSYLTLWKYHFTHKINGSYFPRTSLFQETKRIHRDRNFLFSIYIHTCVHMYVHIFASFGDPSRLITVDGKNSDGERSVLREYYGRTSDAKGEQQGMKKASVERREGNLRERRWKFKSMWERRERARSFLRPLIRRDKWFHAQLTTCHRWGPRSSSLPSPILLLRRLYSRRPSCSPRGSSLLHPPTSFQTELVEGTSRGTSMILVYADRYKFTWRYSVGGPSIPPRRVFARFRCLIDTYFGFCSGGDAFVVRVWKGSTVIVV